jgi:hypothetical protein
MIYLPLPPKWKPPKSALKICFAAEHRPLHQALLGALLRLLGAFPRRLLLVRLAPQPRLGGFRHLGTGCATGGWKTNREKWWKMEKPWEKPWFNGFGFV